MEWFENSVGNDIVLNDLNVHGKCLEREGEEGRREKGGAETLSRRKEIRSFVLCMEISWLLVTGLYDSGCDRVVQSGKDRTSATGKARYVFFGGCAG